MRISFVACFANKLAKFSHFFPFLGWKEQENITGGGGEYVKKQTDFPHRPMIFSISLLEAWISILMYSYLIPNYDSKLSSEMYFIFNTYITGR